MYIDFKKLRKLFGQAIGILVLLYGVLAYIFFPTTPQQNTGVLLAIFGLLISWYVSWLERTK